MPARTKPGLDWAAIRSDFDRGLGYAALARRYPVTRQVIHKRAQREGWEKKRKRTKAYWSNQVATAEIGTDFKLRRLSATRTPEAAARILDALSKGLTRSAAATAGNIAAGTLHNWMRDDADFRDLVVAAEFAAAGDFTAEVYAAAKRGDWKAAAWWLERRDPEHFGAPSRLAAPETIKVVINVGRDEQPAIESPTIDATSERGTETEQ